MYQLNHFEILNKKFGSLTVIKLNRRADRISINIFAFRKNINPRV